MKKKIISIMLALAVSSGFASAASEPDAGLRTAAETTTVTVKLDPSDASPSNGGEFQGWGTSLCWWANRVGYSENMTKQAAKLFYSDEGLSLDIARYNLGGGDDPAHNHITRSDSKIPGYATGYDSSGNITYDWTVDENQRNIALAAKAENTDIYFEGFSNSPPYFMTNSGCSSGAANASNDNLRTDDIDNFGRFIAEVTKHFRDEFGIEFKSYSPMNEPDTSYWGANSPKQEGCHYSPGNMQSKTIIATRRALDAAGLNDVLVAGMDETDINKTVSNYPKLSDEAKTALGRIDTHTYDGTQRAQLKALAREAGKDLWMSEADGGWNGFDLAERIITDMNGMMPAAWVMWDIVDFHRDATFKAPDGSYPEKNNTLNVNGNLWGVAMANHDEENIELSNKYYAYGQFTRYIEPGDTIIASSPSTLAAYNKHTGDIKIVTTNSGTTDKGYIFDLSCFTNVGSSVKTIRSNNLTGSEAEHWKEIGDNAVISGKTVTATAKAGTITTYVIIGAGETGYAVIKGGHDRIKPGSSVKLSLAATFDGDVTWFVSDGNIAKISEEGTVTAISPGSFTVYASIGSYTASRVFSVPVYKTYDGPTDGSEEQIICIDDFTDDFEGSENIFGAPHGVYKDTSSTVFQSGLNDFGNVFAPIKSTATAELTEPVILTRKNKLRMTFNMFNGWEQGGRDNTFSIQDLDGNELVAIYLTGGGYTLQEIRIGGVNVLDTTSVAQCRFDSSGKGADGWDSSKPYRNNAGYNKTAEIEIDGTGAVKVSLTGGLKDTTVEGAIREGADIAAIVLKGDYNTAPGRVSAYDNFETYIISYANELTPPGPTAAPELPENAELIRLDFDGDLNSSSPYGKAEAVGAAVFEDGALKLNGTNNTAIKLTDANGNPLLTGRSNITIAFRIKPTTNSTSWWFYTAPNNSSQTYLQEKYLGVLTGNGKITAERYNNSGARSAAASANVTVGAWNDVIISVNDSSTSIYINGSLAGSAASGTDISEMLGGGPVLYIGKANWVNGEYATGYIDDFVIYNYPLPLLDVSRDGRTISYTSEYKDDSPFDMNIALKDSTGILKGIKTNAESGSFTVDNDGTYTVTQYLWKGFSPMTNTIVKNARDGAYLFVHFVGTESNANQEQIYFSVSQDGSTWKTLNNAMPVLTSSVGERGVRDPFIQRGIDGKYYIIATDLSIYNRRGDSNRWSTCQNSGSKSIVVWESDDLVNWSGANLIEIADKNAGCTWAPESVYDPEQEAYMVFWASKVSDDNYSKQRIYRSYTKDFKTFTPAEIYIDNPQSVIDTTILENDGVYYRFTKDEAQSSITMMKSTSLSNGWEDVASYKINGVKGDTVTGYEGPTIYKLNGEERWCLLLDYFSKSQGYKPFVTDDITEGSFVSASDFTFDATYRHGTVIPITTAEYKSLIEKYNK